MEKLQEIPKAVQRHNRAMLQRSESDLQRAKGLKAQYQALKKQRDQIETQMKDCNWQFHQLTGGWVEITGSELRRVKVARFATMRPRDREQLASEIRQYILDKGGECLALELGEVFGSRIPVLSKFMRQNVGAERRGGKRSAVYMIRENLFQ